MSQQELLVPAPGYNTGKIEMGQVILAEKQFTDALRVYEVQPGVWHGLSS